MNNSKYYPDFIDFPVNTLEIIDIEEIRQYEEDIILEKIKKITEDKLTKDQKRLMVLDEMNLSLSYDSIEEEEENEYEGEVDKSHYQLVYNEKQKKVKPDISFNSTMPSELKDILTDFTTPSKVRDKTKGLEKPSKVEDISEYQTLPSEIKEIPKDLENYWIKYDLYDVKQDIYIENPTLIKLDGDKFTYLYNNQLSTFYFIKNVQFGKEYKINIDVIIDGKYDEKFGLFFCGKNIELEKEKYKLCCPDEMFCRDCMNKNKKRYCLKDHYSININGRAAKKYNRKFHCFGHFLVGKQFENCLDKFSCEACKLLDKYENYYFAK